MEETKEKQIEEKSKEIKLQRINFFADWVCDACGNERWSHFIITIRDKGKQRRISICKDCMDNAELVEQIEEFEVK
jgi:arginase family enzyme